MESCESGNLLNAKDETSRKVLHLNHQKRRMTDSHV
jgi:hypothetical protein